MRTNLIIIVSFLLTSCGAGISDVLEDLGKNYAYYGEGWGHDQILYRNKKGSILEKIPIVSYENDENYIIFKNFSATEEFNKTEKNLFEIKKFILNKEMLPKKYALLYALYGKGDDFYKKINTEEGRDNFSQIVDILENSRYSDSISTFGIIDKNKHKTEYFNSKTDFEKAISEKNIKVKF